MFINSAVTRALVLSALAVIDQTGTVKFVKVMDNPLDLLDPGEVLKTVKASAS